MAKAVMTEAADKIELKLETLLTYEKHIASVDSAVEQIQREDQHFLLGRCVSRKDCPAAQRDYHRRTLFRQTTDSDTQRINS